MARFRYAQFCPLARAVELIGQRWTLLVVRELVLGPKRFSDIKGALAGVSTSVLAQRLVELEERDIVAQRSTPPPTPAVLYELTDTGRALFPAVIELARWGARFLGAPEPGDHIEPDWARLGLWIFASRSPTPRRSVAIALRASPDREIRFHVAGGRRGTTIGDGPVKADVAIRVDSPFVLLALAAGDLPPRQAIANGQLEAEGDLAALDDFPKFFEMDRSPNDKEA